MNSSLIFLTAYKGVMSQIITIKRVYQFTNTTNKLLKMASIKILANFSKFF